MTTYQFVTNYKNNDTLRQSFFELALATFDLNFMPWFELGAWNDDYCCYSYADGDQIIANVSTTRMTVHFQGKLKQAIQIGTVMTHPDYQQQGLAAKLMDYVIATNEEQVDFIYLFANDQVLNFYPKFGFQPYDESQFTISIDQEWQPATKSYRQLNCDSKKDLIILRELALNRLPNSQRLGISDNASLLLFYTTLIFPHHLFYFETEQTLIIAESTSTTLSVFDIVQVKKTDLKPMLSQLINNETATIQLFFTTDNQEFTINPLSQTDKEDYLFIRPQLNTWSNQTLFPLTSHG